MKSGTLKRANELAEIITITKRGLDNLVELKKKRRNDPEDRHYDDCQYSLYIGEYGDNSGNSADLCRYQGNAELLDLIIGTLENQLKEFRTEFETL